MHRGASAPSASNAAVSKELDAVVLRAVSPNPDSRYQSVATFAADLRSVGSARQRTRRTSAGGIVHDDRRRRADDVRHSGGGGRDPVVGHAVVRISPSWLTKAERAIT